MSQDPNPADVLLTKLCSTHHLVHRLLQIAERNPDPADPATSLLYQVAEHSAQDSSQALASVDAGQLAADSKFIHNVATESVATAETRLSTSPLAKAQFASQPPPYLVANCVYLLMHAYCLEYHANQLRTTPSRHAMRMHHQAAVAISELLHGYADLVFNPTDDTDQARSSYEVLFEQAQDAYRQSIHSLQTIAHTTRQRADAVKSATIAALPDQSQIDRIIAEHRNSMELATIAVIRNQDPGYGQSGPGLPIIIYDHDFVITCKAFLDPYAPDTDQELALQHCQLALEQATKLAEQPATSAAAHNIQVSALLMHQFASANIHHLSLQQLQDFINDVSASGVSATSVTQFLMHLADGQDELAYYLINELDLPVAATAEQSDRVINAALAAGLHTTTIQAIAMAMQDDYTRHGIPERHYRPEHLSALIRAAVDQDISLQPVANLAMEVGFTPQQFQDAAASVAPDAKVHIASPGLPQDESTPADLSNQLIVPGRD